MEKIVLRKGRERSVLKRHPWIFSGAVASGGAGFGETVAVAAEDGKPLGYGSYSPVSQIRVRMLSFDPETVPDAAFVERLVAASVARRADFLRTASATNACRVINAENDGLPGVVADLYDGWAVCQFSSAGAEFWKSAVVAALMARVPGCRGVSERTDLNDRVKEGIEKAGGDSRSSTSNLQSSFCVLAGAEPPELIEIFEGPIRYLVDVRNGHKTGFYLDQREARAAVGAHAAGRTVLNCFSYTGGFGLAAAAGGATRVTQVDVSRDALALAGRNAALTFPSDSKPVFDYVDADVFQYLRQCRDGGKSFDMIVLDPPKFASARSQVMKAARGYKDINLLAMKLLRPNGILATFSCSGAMTAGLFDTVVSEASQDARRDFQVIGRTRQGEDHPVSLSFPEGWYLKGLLLKAMD